MAYQALILLAVAAYASAQSYASSYNSVDDPLQTYAPASLHAAAEHSQGPSPLSYDALSGSGPYDHQLLLQHTGYDVTEPPQEPQNPPAPVAPPSAPIYFNAPPAPAPLSLPLLPQSQPQLSYLHQPQSNPLPAPSDIYAPSQSHSSTSFSSPYASYQH